MNKNLQVRDKSIAEQISAMRSQYPHFEISYTSHNSLKVFGHVQPTSRSIIYQFELKYNIIDSPRVYIVSPTLIKNEKGEKPPHLYPNGDLCLYRPAYREFRKSDFLCNTIIPWISLWLYYYEVWLITGVWYGGGEHPSIGKSKSNVNPKKKRFKRRFSH